VIKVSILAMQGVLDSSLGISLDLLHAADGLARSKGQSGFVIERVTTANSGSVRTSSGQRISELVPLRHATEPDVVFLPGSNINEPDKLVPWLESAEVVAVQNWLRAVEPQARLMAAGCVGSFVLAGSGVLDGHCATTTWWLARQFQQRFPNVSLDMHRMVVDADKFITAGAALAQADLTLHVVERLCGPTVASLCSSYMLVDERLSQAHYAIMGHLSRQHPDVLRAEKWIRNNLARSFDIAELSQAVNLTPRTLARRFVEATGTAPYDFIQRLRIERATCLLRTTKLPLQHIAERVGYQDIGVLRRVFKRFNYPMPSEVRRELTTR
jgi:transcriptional regulator GlxA family with amidase domain